MGRNEEFRRNPHPPGTWDHVNWENDGSAWPDELKAHGVDPSRAQFRQARIPLSSLEGFPHKYAQVEDYSDPKKGSPEEAGRINEMLDVARRSPRKLPPVVAVRKGNSHVLIDGAHRAAVFHHLGKKNLRAYVTEPKSDA